MTREQRILGMLTGIALMAAGLVVLSVSVGLIRRALPASERGAAVAAARTPTRATTPITTAAIPASSMAPTASPTSPTSPPPGTLVEGSATPAPLLPTQSPAEVPAITAAATLTVTQPASGNRPTATIVPAAATVTPVSAPPELVLAVEPVARAASLTTSPCASLDGETHAALYQVESPARVGLEQRLCIGGFPADGAVSVTLTGRGAVSMALIDSDGNGFGYAEVRYIPTRADRAQAFNLSVEAPGATASGQITLDPVLVGNSFAPARGDPLTAFYGVALFVESQPREIYLYRRREGDTFTLVRRETLAPSPDRCAALEPCFAAELAVGVETPGEYRFVHFDSGAFQLFPSTSAPFGFMVTEPPMATATPLSPATATPAEVPTLPATQTAVATVDSTPVPTATPIEIVTPTIASTPTPVVIPTVEATATLPAPFFPTPTGTAITAR